MTDTQSRRQARSLARGSVAGRGFITFSTRPLGVRPSPIWRTVTVVANNCVDANTATTAAIVRGRAAETWLAGCKMAARLVDHDGRVYTLGGWPSEVAA